MTLGGVEDQWVRYWDEGATTANMEYEVEAPTQQPAPAKEKEKKKKKGPLLFSDVIRASDMWSQSRRLYLPHLRRRLRYQFPISPSP